jgi:hypothetical protein
MNGGYTQGRLSEEARPHIGNGGSSEGNRGRGFHPAFLDAQTGRIYRSCFADGSPAPFHLLDGLPETLVRSRTTSGRVAEVEASLVSGFERDGRFYTREQAALAVLN